MRSLVIAISGRCEFAEAIINLTYDLGHIIYTLGDLSDSLANLTQQLQIPQLEAGLSDEVDVFVSCHSEFNSTLPSAKHILLSVSSPVESQYDLTWLGVDTNEFSVLQEYQLSLGHLANGADRYDQVMTAATQTLAEIIVQVANDTLCIANKSLSRIPDQVALHRLRAWHQSNETNDGYAAQHGSLFSSFASAASAYKQNCAICFEDQSVSYEQLFSLSTQVAHAIAQHMPQAVMGELPVVALALHKSVELYAAILGVLSLGAVYVPIDPEYPKERIANILKSAAPSLVITQKGVSLADTQSIAALNIDDFGLDINAPAEQLNLHHEYLEQPAVFIYTSGSTGTPKGVQLSHQNILHFCHWYCAHVGLNQQSRALQFTTVCFDASLLDIFPTLFSGARLIVPNEEQRHDFSRLDQLVERHQVTHSFIPPAMLGSLPDYTWPSMIHIVTGGDVCDPLTIKRWSKSRFLHNIYGPTECTVLATTERFEAEANNKVIGKPIANTRIYLLNDAMQPAKTGEHGELYISGKGVGLGYYNAPEMTAERFLPDHFGDNPRQLMYRTGDVCYWDEAGRINFVGRKDNQLKIRGFRVELGEIENAILASGLYAKCVVIATAQKQIRAFVANPSASAKTELLQDALGKTLPNYMLPAHIIELDEFPSTVNGKIDRKQLLEIPMPTRQQDDAGTLNDTEISLRRIWAEALDLDTADIGKQDSFFDLGGHSLLVSKMLLSVKNQFSGGFTLARFMENPTLEGLASLLTNGDLQKGDQISERIYTDMVLSSDIRPSASTNPNCFSPGAVLLTGANGFLGSHILEQLISLTNATIYCLIRASSEEYAYSKLREAYQKYNFNDLQNHPRIKVLIGDLSAPSLGLSDARFLQLAEEIDVIYHNGAQVNHIYDYDHLYQSNVGSTIDLLRLATSGKTKQFVYISTLSAASNVNREGRLVEDGPAAQLPVFVNNGYNLTKWVCEQLVWQAYQRGLPVTLVRPGNVCGHSKTGHCYPDQNRILLLLKGCAQLGNAPDWQTTFDLCPVDFIAKGVVVCTTKAEGHIPVLHFHNPMPLQWSDYVGRLNHHQVPVKLIPAEQWRSNLLTLDESNALYNVISFYLDDQNEDIADISMIDYTATLDRLQQFGMRYPDKNHALVDANLGFLIRSHFIQVNNQQEFA